MFQKDSVSNIFTHFVSNKKYNLQKLFEKQSIGIKTDIQKRKTKIYQTFLLFLRGFEKKFEVTSE